MNLTRLACIYIYREREREKKGERGREMRDRDG